MQNKTIIPMKIQKSGPGSPSIPLGALPLLPDLLIIFPILLQFHIHRLREFQPEHHKYVRRRFRVGV
jgi:hypothetical protein